MTATVSAITAVLIGSAVIVLLIEALKRLWARAYFPWSVLLVGFEGTDRPHALAVAARFAIPFVAGFVAGSIHAEDAVPIGFFAGLAGALALVWPVFLLREVIPPALYGREFELRLVHSAFVAAYALLGLGGGIAADMFNRAPLTGIVHAAGELVYQLGVALIAGFILLAIQERRYRRIVREHEESGEIE